MSTTASSSAKTNGLSDGPSSNTTQHAAVNPRSKGPNGLIVIIGGSLGGLFAGLALKSHGYRTVILERNPTNLLHNQGAGIVAGGDTIEFFRRYDRTGKPMAVPSWKRMYLDQAGKVVHEEANRQNMTSWDLSYYLLRANYDGVRSGYVDGVDMEQLHNKKDGEVEYRFGCNVVDLRDEGEKGVRVVYRRKSKDEDGEEREESLMADLVVGADGPSSTIRKMLEPGVERKYAGYCVIRGTVPEMEASEAAREVFVERFTFFHAPGIQNLTYTIAGENGTTEPGRRLLNFVWYTNFEEGSEELDDIMTDIDGKRRRITIPPGTMREEAWERVKKRGQGTLPPQMAEMVNKTKQPFVQAITDVITPRNMYMDGKVVLVGDALAGFRPHTVASTSQAAYDSMILAEWLDGDKSTQDFVRETVQYARLIQDRGVKMGNRSQFETLPIEEYIKDRNLASTPRKDEIFPEWTQIEV